ncbi:thiopeptide-type bacteriocin biosynthesis protein, partial [Bacillus cereus]|uniref:thiopeptide-type bacteriocin biosynthesis protein n=1 Tax=Bacillus cereus TaxID=1396 RepID=UPI0024BCF6C5
TCVRENNHIINLEYNTEYKRYGGENGIEIAEEHFYHSSIMCLKLIQEINKKTNRLRISIEIILSYLKAMNMNLQESIKFLEGYYLIWKRYVYSNTNNVEEFFANKYIKQKKVIDKIVVNYFNSNNNKGMLGEKWSNHLNLTVQNLENDWDRGELIIDKDVLAYINIPQKIAFIVTSYVHMTNNRLGIMPQEEAYLSYMLLCSLKSLYKSRKG